MSNQFLTLAILLSLLLIGCDRPTPAQRDASELIVYTTLRPENQDIYIVDGPDSEPQRMTNHLALDYNATFSPDGRWLVFTSDRGGNTDLYALDLQQDRDPVRLTHHPSLDDAADISPDGTEILFVSNRAGNPELYTMPFSPSDPSLEPTTTRLTSNSVGDFNPTYSPDGSSIAFARQTEVPPGGRGSLATSPITDVFVMEADGSDVRRLTNWNDLYKVSGAPAWSPSGEYIYFQSWRRNLDGYIGRIRPDSTGFEGVGPRGFHLGPAVSPNGRISFYRGSPPEGGGDLFRERGVVHSMNREGTNLRVEVDSSRLNPCLGPAFTPDGQMACHGRSPEPIEDVPRMANDRMLSRPGTHRTIHLPDRSIDVVGIRGYFPDIVSDNRIVYSEWLTNSTEVDQFGYAPIVTSQLDGSDRRVLLERDRFLAWNTKACTTTEGGWIAFNVGPSFAPPDAALDIWTMRADGSHLQNVTQDSTSNDAFPVWSADCGQIFFRSGRDGNKEIYRMGRDGSNPTRITNHPSVDTAPTVSPDGRHVVFSTDRGGDDMKLWTQNVETGRGQFLNPNRIDQNGHDMHPHYSPDGKWIVFISSRGGNLDEWPFSGAPRPSGEVWITAADEEGPAIRITNDKWEDGLARWGIVHPTDR